ncbi:MAG: histidine kinase [Bacteroidota bacterium]|nr:histidine kinase [Bacteroidota bacterium]
MLNAFVVISLLLLFKKSYKAQLPNSGLYHFFNYAIIIALVLFAAQYLFHLSIIKWIWNVSVIALIYLSFFIPTLKNERTIAIAVLPLVFIAFFKDVLSFWPNGFSNQLHQYFDYILPFAIIWLITIWFIFRQQQKKWVTELKLKQEEAIKNKQIAEQNAALEILVQKRTAEITSQKEALEKAIQELNQTQDQLIQSEKMASLGELTAGIAHEIQNPLNFVNNFSEVNKELLTEMKMEIEKGNYADVIAIANDVIQNEDKINQHGKRADAIVKGMLQHSRTSSGIKEPTKLNALTDEYLRLAYHGLRAKDKTFNAILKTDYDASIEDIQVVPQEMGRVILNLITNAFYVVNEKKKTNMVNYEPIVSVKTKQHNGRVEVMVEDNGNGIPPKIMDKIFQPFFTTKPTGQGTGLGLSLSYDIVKAHGGELTVKSKEGEGSTFIITLPANQ